MSALILKSRIPILNRWNHNKKALTFENYNDAD